MAKKETGNLSERCVGHAKHMCELVRARNMREVADLAKDATFICHICGRAAAKAGNLCEAVEI